MKILLLGLLCSLLWCCKKTPFADSPRQQRPEQHSVKRIRYLALGDSYTIGQAVPADQSFPLLLTDTLNTDTAVEVSETVVIAQTGWTTADLLAGIGAQQPTDTVDLVTLLIGVNDQYRGYSVAAYGRGFRDCVQQAIALAGGRPSRVIVVSIPDYGFTPFGIGNKETISAAIDGFNEVNNRIAVEMGVNYMNITPISRSAVSGLVAADGLHPSGKQYQLWVDKVFPLVRQLLQTP